MKIVNLAEAKARLSAFVRQAEQGEMILLARHNRPVVELRRVADKARTKTRPFGLAAKHFRVPDDFDAPLPADILKGFLGE